MQVTIEASAEGAALGRRLLLNLLICENAQAGSDGKPREDPLGISVCCEMSTSALCFQTCRQLFVLPQCPPWQHGAWRMFCIMAPLPEPACQMGLGASGALLPGW